MARYAARQREKAPQKRLLGTAEQGHVDAALGAAQGRRECDQQDLQQVVTLGIARPRVRQTRKTRLKPLHTALLFNQDGKIRSIFPQKKIQQISCAIPLGKSRPKFGAPLFKNFASVLLGGFEFPPRLS